MVQGLDGIMDFTGIPVRQQLRTPVRQGFLGLLDFSGVPVGGFEAAKFAVPQGCAGIVDWSLIPVGQGGE